MPAPSFRTFSLVGRLSEKQRIDGLIRDAASGRGGALILRGEAGIGKSSLLTYAARTEAARTVRASGSEFEQELPYAGLHQLCQPLLGHLTELPPRLRDALRSAFGLTEGVPDPFQAGLATLELLTAAAQRQPLLCLIDDAQWLDDASAKVVLFLARRVAADSIALLVAARTGSGPDRFEQLPRHEVPGLSHQDAQSLLAAQSPFPLDDQVSNQLITEAQGNPLALLELPRAGGFAPPGVSSAPARVEHDYRARLDGLSMQARLLLTVAGADPTGDAVLLWQASRRLGIDLAAAVPEVTATGLAELDHRFRFCHPLARSAAYVAASSGDRRAAHAALAAVTDPTTAPDRRAWHRAQSVTGPDDDVAAELEQAASRAQARGGVAAAAAFLSRAVGLSADLARRAERTLAAGRANLDAGQTDTAMDLLATLEPAALDEQLRARVELLQGRAAFARHRDDAGPELMTRAAQRMATIDAQQSRQYFLDALEMSLFVGRGVGVVHKVVAAARQAPPSVTPDLLDALIQLVDAGYPAATRLLRSTLFDGAAPLWRQHPALASLIATELWDQDTFRTITQWLVETGRESGSPSMLQLGLAQEAGGAITEGNVTRALAASAEEIAVADAAGVMSLQHHQLYLAAVRGRRDDFERLLRAGEAAPQGAGRATNLHAATAILNNGLGDYPAALAAAREATEHDDLFLTAIALPELVEAAVRCDDRTTAERALATLTERSEASGTRAALAMAAYSRGLVTGAEEHFREAIDLLGDGYLISVRGRAHLLYGEWLFTRRRRQESGEQLRIAYGMLSKSGHEGFARRAADGLRLLGERVESRLEAPVDMLTMQELAVARLVASGATSQKVAGQLFISKRTVDAHLRGIFQKLGLTSRRQLENHPGLLEASSPGAGRGSHSG
jgi:DNA-binding CsgD family transcriptional regulator